MHFVHVDEYADETSLASHNVGLFIAELDLGGGNLMQGERGVHLMMDLTMEVIVSPIYYHCNSKSCREHHALSKLVVAWYM